MMESSEIAFTIENPRLLRVHVPGRYRTVRLLWQVLCPSAAAWLPWVCPASRSTRMFMRSTGHWIG